MKSGVKMTVYNEQIMLPDSKLLVSVNASGFICTMLSGFENKSCLDWVSTLSERGFNFCSDSDVEGVRFLCIEWSDVVVDRRW